MSPTITPQVKKECQSTRFPTIPCPCSARVQRLFDDYDPSHDWEHVQRVVSLAKMIAKKHNVDSTLVNLIAILHDVGDHKYVKDGETCQGLLSEICEDVKFDPEVKEIVIRDIPRISYSYEVKHGLKPESMEAKIVQDADRLDALGAIGFARCVAFNAARRQPIYTPGIPILTLEDLLAGEKPVDHGSAVDHMQIKFPNLPRMMNTVEGKELGETRLRTLYTILAHMQSEISGC